MVTLENDLSNAVCLSMIVACSKSVVAVLSAKNTFAVRGSVVLTEGPSDVARLTVDNLELVENALSDIMALIIAVAADVAAFVEGTSEVVIVE